MLTRFHTCHLNLPCRLSPCRRRSWMCWIHSQHLDPRALPYGLGAKAAAMAATWRALQLGLAIYRLAKVAAPPPAAHTIVAPGPVASSTARPSSRNPNAETRLAVRLVLALSSVIRGPRVKARPSRRFAVCSAPRVLLLRLVEVAVARILRPLLQLHRRLVPLRPRRCGS